LWYNDDIIIIILQEGIMRFYILSDLHLNEKVEDEKVSDRIKKICSKIRKSTDIGENILFIILGDIIDKGNGLSFDTASDNLNLIYNELKDYSVKFEFVPGNHDIESGSLCLFDKLISKYGSRHAYESVSVYSSVYENVNFIFADSTLSRDYKAPGRLNVKLIKENIKSGFLNILFCHHAISHGHGDPHDVIEDSATVLAELRSNGISFFFHGHVHDAKITIPENGMIEIGCGSLAGDTSWLKGVLHQFLVGYIQEGNIPLIERWVDAEDGHGDFALNQLYPEPRDFGDPDSFGKNSYPAVPNYIPRWVCSYEEASHEHFVRLLSKNKRLHLSKAVQKHKKILLLCDAGMGKSIELNNLAYEFSQKFHTLYYSLADYNGQKIHDILPETYKHLPPNRIALLLDGYDEMDSNLAKQFRINLKLYTQDATGVHIVISSRSNFCGNENSNESRTFPGFNVYVLDLLDSEDIKMYLESKAIDTIRFLNCAFVKGVWDLLYNPFYLIRLVAVYTKENNLPAKKQLMDKLIIETFELDDEKFLQELGDKYHELFSSLEVLAIAMQLMHHQTFDDRDEYQTLIPLSERELIKKSGLLKREGTGWKFIHNNFREYLAARCLSHLPQEFVTSICCDGKIIKPYWVNTFGYLTGFDLEWSLIDWIMDNSPTALVKFEPDRLNEELRVEVFKRIFEKFETQYLHFYDDMCDEAELAHFAKSNEILDYLLDRIKNPKHSISQYTALNILRNYPNLFGKDNTVRENLLECCNRYPTTSKENCRLAILALCQLKLYTTETTCWLMEKFRGINEDYIRLGMYEYMLVTKEYDLYPEYCLAGIEYIVNGLKFADNGRIGNEAFELVNCLKSMSTVGSITLLIKWFSQEKHPDFHNAEAVLSSAVMTAVTLYKESHLELFDVILSSYIDTAKVWNTTVSKALVKFFVETGTQYAAAIGAANHFEDKPHHISDLVQSDPLVMEELKKAYLDGRLKSHRVFYEIVLWYVRDEVKYLEYAKLIQDIDGIDLPAYKAPINYDLLRQKSAQEYFEILFNADKRVELTTQLLHKINNPDLTTKQLLDADINLEHNSALWRLKSAMYRYGPNVKVYEFFDHVEMNKFVLWSASQYLSKKSMVVVSDFHKEKLREIVATLLQIMSFKDSVKYSLDTHNFSLGVLIPELLSVIRFLDYPLDEATLLDLTELPAFIFDESNEKEKYIYLQSKISTEKLKIRMVQNVKAHQVKDLVLIDHINFFDSCRDSSLAEYAFMICKDPDDTCLRSTAWKYLYNTVGVEYITNELLPIADTELLVEIQHTCKDISKKKLCAAMEREYTKQPSVQLQAYLITYGSCHAIDDYVKKVSVDKCPPKGTGTLVDGPTGSIASISDPIFLLQLERLLIVVFDPEFRDNTWRGLRNSLAKAFVNCGTVAYEETIEILMKHRPSVDVNETNYRYCNSIIDDIEHARKMLKDTPLALSETRRILIDVKKILLG